MSNTFDADAFVVILDVKSLFVFQNCLLVMFSSVKRLLLLAKHAFDYLWFVVWELEPRLDLEMQRNRVHLIAQTIRLWTIGEHMPKMGLTLATLTLK